MQRIQQTAPPPSYGYGPTPVQPAGGYGYNPPPKPPQPSGYGGGGGYDGYKPPKPTVCKVVIVRECRAESVSDAHLDFSLGIDINSSFTVVDTATGGQCVTQNIVIGDCLVGINGKNLNELGIHTIKNFTDKLQQTQKPCSLNFNCIKKPEPYEPPKPKFPPQPKPSPPPPPQECCGGVCTPPYVGYSFMQMCCLAFLAAVLAGGVVAGIMCNTNGLKNCKQI